ncbi:hypothetical protein STEG23_015275, partial [Scotinomys teguina]
GTDLPESDVSMVPKAGVNHYHFGKLWWVEPTNDSAAVKETEDEKLWIASRLIWFDQPRPPDSSSDVPNPDQLQDNWLKDEASQTAPVKIGPSS